MENKVKLKYLKDVQKTIQHAIDMNFCLKTEFINRMSELGVDIADLPYNSQADNRNYLLKINAEIHRLEMEMSKEKFTLSNHTNPIALWTVIGVILTGLGIYININQNENHNPNADGPPLATIVDTEIVTTDDSIYIDIQSDKNTSYYRIAGLTSDPSIHLDIHEAPWIAIDNWKFKLPLNKRGFNTFKAQFANSKKIQSTVQTINIFRVSDPIIKEVTMRSFLEKEPTHLADGQGIYYISLDKSCMKWNHLLLINYETFRNYGLPAEANQKINNILQFKEIKLLINGEPWPVYEFSVVRPGTLEAKIKPFEMSGESDLDVELVSSFIEPEHFKRRIKSEINCIKDSSQ